MNNNDLDFDDIMANLNLPELEIERPIDKFEKIIENVVFSNGVSVTEESLLPNLNPEIIDGEQYIIIDGRAIPYEEYQAALGDPVIDPPEAPAVGGGGASHPYVLGDIGPDADLTDLLPPTALSFPSPEERELDEFLEPDDDPEIAVDSDIPSVFAGDAFADESALDNGSNSASDAEMASGNISIVTGQDDIGSLLVNGVDVTNGGIVEGEFGVLQVILNDDGTYSWVYTLTDSSTLHSDPDSTGTPEGVSESFEFVLTDDDGDVATDTLVLDILDDGPIARDDFDRVVEGATTDGNVLTGADGNDPDGSPDASEADTVGADGALVSSVSSVNESSASQSVAGTDATVVQGAYGVLTIFADGSYSYASDPNAPEGAVDVFTYEITDGDGDTDQAELSITVTDSGLSVVDDGVVVDEADLADGSAEASGSLADNVSGGTGPYTYELVGDGSGSNGMLVLGADGSYTYTLLTPYAHGSEDAPIVETFQVNITDADGNVVQAQITVGIVDDVPVAENDLASVSESCEDGAETVSGDVLENDMPGADGWSADGAVIGVTFGGAAGDVNADGAFEIAGTYGTLTLNSNGTYTYELNSDIPNDTDGSDIFTYTVRDADGDEMMATLTISVSGGSGPTVVAGNDALRVDEGALDTSQDGLDLAAGGVTGSHDPNGPEETDATGALTFTAGTDAITSIAFLTTGITIENSDGTDLTSSITWAMNGDNLEGSIDGAVAIILSLGGDIGAACGADANVTITATLTNAFPHAINTAEDEITIQNISIRAVDADGDFINGVVSVTVTDDVPTVFTPEEGSVANEANVSSTHSLWESDPSGADGLASLTFTGFVDGSQASDANGNPINLNGSEPVYIFGNGTDTLTATTDITNSDPDSVVYTVELDPVTGEYTVTVLQETVFSGEVIEINNLSSDPGGGNTDFRGIGSTDPDNDLDILLSGTGTVNTNSTEIGVGAGQSFSDNDALRMDLVNDLVSSTDLTTNPSGFAYSGHVADVTSFTQEISFVQGGGNNTTAMTITAIAADDDGEFAIGSTPEAGESFVAIDSITIFDENGNDVTTSVTITTNANGSVTIDGIKEGWSYSIATTDAFNAIQVEAIPGEKPFKLGLFSIGGGAVEVPIDLSYDIELVDGDGDSVTSTIDITIADPPETSDAAADSAITAGLKPLAIKTDGEEPNDELSHTTILAMSAMLAYPREIDVTEDYAEFGLFNETLDFVEVSSESLEHNEPQNTEFLKPADFGDTGSILENSDPKDQTGSDEYETGELIRHNDEYFPADDIEPELLLRNMDALTADDQGSQPFDMPSSGWDIGFPDSFFVEPRSAIEQTGETIESLLAQLPETIRETPDLVDQIPSAQQSGAFDLASIDSGFTNADPLIDLQDLTITHSILGI